ncbi:hypothetical protein PLICRDRAFT_128275 [Plicaturopsis crispa FD-325 SS-3]|nr:hypothetical protein PLICRDRAFT_128275 [Plicaturopsis crispa FD-325 SS-3]
MFQRTLLLLLAFSFVSLVSAQFNFFEQMFHHQGQQQQQQHQPSGSSQWAAHADQVQCSQYLCPTTLACVPKPVDCGCPSVEDIKCVVPDGDDDDAGTVLCVRGKGECKAVERLMKRKW